jgi:tetratricopeptide (TPR) repeat protein
MRAFRLRNNRWGVASGLRVTALVLAANALNAQGARPTQSPPPAIRLRDSAIALIAKAIPTGDMDGLRVAQAVLQRALTVAPNDPWLLHYSGYAAYRQATIVMGRDRGDAGPFLEQANEMLERSAALAAIPESFALRSGALGMMIGSNPLKGMTLGPRSGEQMEKALELDPVNPRVWLLRGIGAFNTPAMFGGGLDKAEEYLKKSITLYAKDKPVAPWPSWGAHEAHAWLGQVYAKQDRDAEARAQYVKALEIEPNDMWVKMSLLPALDKK